MSLVVGNILQITLEGLVLAQQSLNVFFYQVSNVPTPPEGVSIYEYICERFDVVVAAKQQNLIPAEAQLTNIRVDNLTNGVDFFDYVISRTGVVAGDCAPSFNAYNFILRRTTLVTRNGSKRVGGVPENWTDGNSFVGLTAALTDYGAAISSPLVTADATPDPFAVPVIVGRSEYTTSEGKQAYQLDLTKINPIQSAAFTALSTQRSRKLGRGK